MLFEEKLTHRDLIRMGFREITPMTVTKWIRKIAGMISGRSALSASFSRKYEHKKGTEELVLWLETEASHERVCLRGVSPNEL
uniref:Transposase n=1 Tax=Steinernema glaseri TaxID=37863 RepID=A0A1I7ZTR7_9BILA